MKIVELFKKQWFNFGILLSFPFAFFFDDIGQVLLEYTIYLTSIIIFVSNLNVLFSFSAFRKELWLAHGISLFIIFILSPMVAYSLGYVFFHWDTNAFFGFIILGILPTTVASQVVYTGIAKGNVLLSSMNSVSSNLIATVSIPFFITFFFKDFSDIYFWMAFEKSFFIIMIPVILSQIVRRFFPRFFDKSRVRNFNTYFSQIGILVIIFASLAANHEQMFGDVLPGLQILKIFLVTAFFHLILLCVSFIVVQVFQLDYPEAKSVLFSGSEKTLSIGVAIIIGFFPYDAGQGILMLLFFNVFQLIFDHYLAHRLKRFPKLFPHLILKKSNQVKK